MKNHFRNPQCVGDEKYFVESLNQLIEGSFYAADHTKVGWLYNAVKALELKADGGGDDGSDNAGKFEEIKKVIEEMMVEQKKQASGLLYLKKELDLVKDKLALPKPSEPAPSPAPAPTPEKPAPAPAEPAPVPEDPPKEVKKNEFKTKSKK